MLSDTIKTEDLRYNNILHPITRHSRRHPLEKSLKPHRVPYDVRGGRWAIPLEAWQPGRTVVAALLH
eukprot:SAG25_NODE_10879_length_320_cov_1.402715_1_plen_66_part_10